MKFVLLIFTHQSHIGVELRKVTLINNMNLGEIQAMIRENRQLVTNEPVGFEK